MKAIVNTARGPAAETLHLCEIDLPEPGPGAVRVKVMASGVNPSDVKVRAGAQGPMMADQVVIHNDGAGVIDAVGTGVDPSRIGQRVWLFEVNRAHGGLAQGSVGTAADYVCVPDNQAVPLPANTSFAAGACLGVPAMTAHRAVTCGGDVAGKTVLVTGGAGAVGHSAIQIAKGKGARVIATVSSAKKAQIATEAGADAVVKYRDEDLVARLKVLAPDGIDHVADVDFAAHVALYPEFLKIGATVGAYATATNLTPEVPFYPLAFRNISVQPFVVYSMSDVAKAAAITDIVPMLERGQLTPRIGRTFALTEAGAAHVALEAGEVIGNIVIEIATA